MSEVLVSPQACRSVDKLSRRKTCKSLSGFQYGASASHWRPPLVSFDSQLVDIG